MESGPERESPIREVAGGVDSGSAGACLESAPPGRGFRSGEEGQGGKLEVCAVT